MMKMFDHDFGKKIWQVCKYMGWDLDYVLDMPIEAFNQVYDFMVEEMREERMAIERERLRYTMPSRTLRG